jgi:hypothetical protein
MMNRPRQFRPFNEARAFVHSLALPNEDAWKAYCKSGERPRDVPSAPHITYKGQFHGYGDWLGTGNARGTKPIKDLPMDKIKALYQEDGMGLRALATKYGVGKDTIKRRLTSMGVDTTRSEVDTRQQVEARRRSSREWKTRQDEEWQKKEKARKSRAQKKKRKAFFYDNLSTGILRDID